MNIYQKDHTQRPEIFTLIRAHKNQEAKKHLKFNPDDIFLKGWMDDTALHIAALSGNFEMVQFLVQNNANVNAERSGLYATPLCWADNFEIAKYLLDNGATMNDKELLMATSYDKIEVVDLLLYRGAKINENEPQYLDCKSIDCIKIYLNYGISINGTDKNNSTLLHKLAWLDLPLVFDFAYHNGCVWRKDNSSRTPYYLAKQGNRSNILKHFKENYSDLVAYKFEPIPITDYQFEPILYLKQSPNQSDCFIGLTQDTKLIKYILFEDKLSIVGIAKINISYIQNFTFDKNGNIIIPTSDNQLLVVAALTFQLLYTIDLEEYFDLNQIEYLPSKGIFLGSSGGWNLILLSEEYKVISQTHAEAGTILPITNQNDNLISVLSADQETFYVLYEIQPDLSITTVDIFFKDWDNTSSGFCFQNNDFAVSYPNEIEYYSFENGILDKKWEIDISKYKSKYDLSDLALLDENIIIAGKGKTLLYIDSIKKAIYREEKLDLSAEIRNLYLDKEKKYLFISTSMELKLIKIAK
jgi:ankyrin repeat protein